MRRHLLLLTALLAGAAGRLSLVADDLLARGNEAYEAGRFEEAAAAYESEENDEDILVRRFNAGVSWARAGQVDKALERFQEVSAKADDELHRAASYNAAHAAFTRGSALAGEAENGDAPAAAPPGAGPQEDPRIRKLTEAAAAFQQSVQLFRSIDPPDDAVTRNIGVVKTALRATLDAIARIEAEKKRQAEDEALKDPARLVKALADKERLHRGLSRALSKETGKSVRLGSRRLRKSTAENRALAEKLHHVLTAPPPSPPAAPPGQPQPAAPPAESDEDKARREKAAEHVARAIEAMKDAEVTHSKMQPLVAAAGHSRAVVELRGASESFALNIGEVIAEAAARQEALNGAMESLAAPAAGAEKPEPGAGSVADTAGKKIIDAIKDNVLAPLARLVRPESLEDARLLADDEDDVVWGAGVLSQAEIPPTPEAPAAQPGAPPDPHAQGQPKLSAEEARKLSEELRKAGKEAQEASSRAKDELAAGRATPAIPEGKKALEALKRAADLLPKPPKPPVERLKELIVRQEQAGGAVDGVARLAAEAQGPARKELERTQRLDGREAGGIADELDAQQSPGSAASQPHGGEAAPEQVAAAVAKIREGQEKVFSSAELVAQERDADARTAVDRDVVLFKEALELLEGKKDDQEEEKKKQDQEKQEQQKQPDPARKDDKKKDEKKPQQMTPRDARFQQQEMDRKRREEEKKLFTAPSTLTVERDW